MTQGNGARTSGSWTWLFALILLILIAARMPSIAQPAGGDQFLYSYVAGRVLDGGVPYRDAFEQKPPGIFAVYALMWGFWPNESVVAAADALAAVLVASLLWGFGRRMFNGAAGPMAAVLFLLLGDPGIQRLGGMQLRAQCETFIGLAVVAAIAVAWSAGGRAGRLLLAGALCGVAVWLKYNAIVYALPIALAVGFAGPASAPSARLRSLYWMAAGGVAVLGIGLLYFASAGALGDLWAGSVAYNLAYSGETYRGAWHALEDMTTLPVNRARVDGLWFMGGLGVLALVFAGRPLSRARTVAIAWVAACVLSIALSGARGLPQYFVQAQPALALAAAGGLVIIWRGRRNGTIGRIVLAAGVLAIVAGAWRVGSDKSPLLKPRLFGIPQSVENMAFDASYMSGRLARSEYLARFDREGTSRFSPAAVERLAAFVDEHTPEATPTYVFGFASGGVYVKSRRPSASRFFWSRPIVLEFERTRPGYGSAGLLADLERERPAVIALQKHDWGLAEDVKDSLDFFMTTPHLREWLDAGYVPDYEDALFAVWRRR